MPARRFEEVELGDELELTLDVSLERVRRFTRAANMTLDRFTDHEAAKKEGPPARSTVRVVATDLDAAARTVQLDLTIANEAKEARVVGTAVVKL